MTPAMYMRLKDLFVAEGLTADFKVQWRQWRDNGKAADQFIVFRPSGGTDSVHHQPADDQERGGRIGSEYVGRG